MYIILSEGIPLILVKVRYRLLSTVHSSITEKQSSRLQYLPMFVEEQSRTNLAV